MHAVARRRATLLHRLYQVAPVAPLRRAALRHEAVVAHAQAVILRVRFVEANVGVFRDAAGRGLRGRVPRVGVVLRVRVVRRRVVAAVAGGAAQGDVAHGGALAGGGWRAAGGAERDGVF